MKYKLNEILNIIGGGTPKTSVKEYWNGNIPWLSIADFSGKTKFVYKTEKTITEEGLKNSSTKILKRNDIIISARGTVGEMAMIPFDMAFNQSCYGLRAKTEIVDSNFLYYLIKNEIRALKHNTHGSVFDTITKDTFSNILVDIPELNTQLKIADFMSKIDNKIEINEGINDNLREQQLSIYFDYLETHSSIEVKLDELVTKSNTGADAIQKAPIVDYDTGIRCARVGDMSNNRPVHQWGYTKVTEEVYKQYKLYKDDILVTRTATLGLNTIMDKEYDAVYNNGLIRLQIDKNKAFPLLVYIQFQSKDFLNYISRINGETSVRPNMKINYLLDYKFSIVDISKQEKIFNILEPLFIKQREIIFENEKLASLRDSLLPKLMSGEIDVSNINLDL